MTRTKGALDSYAPALMLQGMLAYQANDIGQATTYSARSLAARRKASSRASSTPRRSFAAMTFAVRSTR